MSDSSSLVDGYVRLVPVIPVVTIEDPRISIDLAQVLLAAGLKVIEITLRTPGALDAINAISKAHPDTVVAAGTVVEPSQINEALDAGAKFIVTPGTPLQLAEKLRESAVPVMPGCATVSEAMMLASLGFHTLKFFPAGAAGGVAWLKAIQGPLPRLAFCPTGGIDAANASSYLALPNVPCIGGSWVAPREALKRGDLSTVKQLAVEAASLRQET